MERPKKCYIRQEWVESIAYLTPEQRCQFYESCFFYCYSGVAKTLGDVEVKAAFNMIKGSLDLDCNNYNAVVVKNRQNGSKNKPSQRDPTQKDPNTPKHTQTLPNNNIHIHLKESFKTFSVQGAERDKLVKDVEVNFFKQGVNMPLAEAEKFINYYDSRGWVDKGGNKIVDVIALTNVWRNEGSTPYFARVRKKWADFLYHLDVPEYNNILIRAFVRAEIKKADPGILHFVIRSEKFAEWCENHLVNRLQVFCALVGAKAICYDIIDEILLPAEQEDAIV